jgi:hypothetical protein
MDAMRFSYWRNANEKEQRTQSCPEKVCCGCLRNVWWSQEPSAASQQWRSNGQPPGKHNNTMPGLPHKNASLDRELGEGQYSACDMPDMRHVVSAKAVKKVKALRKSGVLTQKWQDCGRTTVGVTHRVARIKAIGNGQVPAVAALAWRLLTEEQI